ncbi:fatty acid desaturase family protein [Sphingobacterium pedocola]|uniref:Acyl-CoA desaturase n=1 Tax=Sphingobacterium pedocola TaxID=2082722 RepID=A0ABR9T6R2_9SPHI|nr:acyl-CoA desaturase [Sphingobacterium pedocola]MBE8721035.1 acyl-CoA desaturase [Sphingobacterium pedocola]
MKSTIKFNNANTLFSKALKEKINTYFKNNNLNKTGGRKILAKGIILFASFLGIYSTLLLVQPHWAIGIILCALFGANLAAIGFNVMHDAGHDTFSKNKKFNNILSYSANLMGANIYFWKLKHNIAHHTFTNIEGEDHDIDVKFMRLHKEQKYQKHHKFQQYYFLALYGISYLAWIFYQDYEKYFKAALGKNNNAFSFPVREKVIFWISKAINLILFIILPIIFVGPIKTLIGLLIVGVVCGLMLAIVFQLAHVVSETSFNIVEDDNRKIENEWMIHQLNSTANFATKNKFLTWLLGGLNFQVEHHLFPKISHIHYPAINKIIRQTCVEYKINYIEFPTFAKAFNSHVNVIKEMASNK